MPRQSRNMSLFLAAGSALALALAGAALGATDPVAFELARAREAGVSFTVERRTFTGPREPRDAYDVQVKFSPMTREQFDSLTASYGGSGFVPYAPERQYELSDFLPPKMQALLGHRFEYLTETDVPWVRDLLYEVDGESSIYTVSNCYTTVWEVCRRKRLAEPTERDVFCLFWTSEYAMQEELDKPEYGAPVAVQELRLGDVVLFYERVHESYRRLLHAAVFVDRGLYFEKTDTFEEYAWRLVHFPDMRDKLAGLCTEGALEFEFRSYHAAFPHPRAAFGLSPDAMEGIPPEDRSQVIIADQPGLGGRALPGVYRIGEVDIVVDPQSGRGVLDPHSRYRSAFKPLDWTK